MEHEESLYHDICPVCYWENDPIQNDDPDLQGGANKISLNAGKENFRKWGAIDIDYIRYVRAPLDSEK